MRRLLLLLAMLAAPVQARTVTAISAAHPWLPCGTRVRVTHKGRSLVVPIRDRCDCNSIDLSAGAAYRLGVPLDGIARVGIEY